MLCQCNHTVIHAGVYLVLSILDCWRYLTISSSTGVTVQVWQTIEWKCQKEKADPESVLRSKIVHQHQLRNSGMSNKAILKAERRQTEQSSGRIKIRFSKKERRSQVITPPARRQAQPSPPHMKRQTEKRTMTTIFLKFLKAQQRT